MRQILILLVIITISNLSCNIKNHQGNSTFISYADSLFQTNVDSANIAGASVIVVQNGEKLLDKSYGYANLELEVPMPENASFEIGSVTKQFTAAAILKLVEEGRLSLDDDFTKYIEYYTKGRLVTINKLLNHTSGLPEYVGLPELEKITYKSYKRDTILRLMEQHNFLFEPGEAFIYNSLGYFILGLIIEEISGMSYEDYLKEQFFIPLGMHNTYYSSTSKVIHNKAYGYDFSEEGLIQKAYVNYTWPYSGGSLSSTAEDLLIWMRSLHGGMVFDEKYYELFTNSDTLNNGVHLRYAMGLENYMFFGHQEIGHGGGIPGFLTAIRYFPDEDIFMICLINTYGPLGPYFFANELLWKLIDKKETETVEIDIDLDSLSGIYTGQTREGVISIEVKALNKSLTISTIGQNRVDTIKNYLGDGSWSLSYSLITIKNDEFSMDDQTQYFRLEKEK